MYRSMLFLILCFSIAAGGTGTQTYIETHRDGLERITVSGEYAAPGVPSPVYDPPEVLWQYTQATGLQQKCCPIGYGADYVFTGGWYGGAIMFQGSSGDGTPLWIYEPQTMTDWSNLGTGVGASEAQDYFFAVQNWDTDAANTAVHCFSGASGTPLWTYQDPTWNSGSVDSPGKYACSADGSVFACGGAIGDHLAIQFFTPGSSTPFATYEDPALQYYPRQLRLTADGSKCIFRTSATLYRIDTATGTLESTYALDASNDCFGVSPDGSVVAYGFTAARIAEWDGSQYNLTAGTAVSGYYGGAAAVAADNSTVYFGFYKNNYLTNRIIRFDLETDAVVWTYDYPTGSGGYQDVMEWMECSTDGRWMVAGTWGCQSGGGDEVSVFDDLNPEAPVFSIDTPGSIFNVDISSDGRYVTAAGKHVHANQMGSGTDVYMAEIDVMGTSGGNPEGGQLTVSVSPNPAIGSFAVTAAMAEAAGELSILDLSGRTVFQGTLGVSGSIQVNKELPSGLYSCIVQSGAETASARLVIID